MVTPTRFGLAVRVALSYEAAVAAVKDALRAEGFGVLTEIDVQQTLRDKIGADFTQYDIIGACNPALAHRALTADLEVGLLLPCNVVVYEDPETHEVHVVALDPEMIATLAGTDALAEVARDARERLARALTAVETAAEVISAP